MIEQARTFLAKSEPRKALLCLQSALHYNSKDLDACRLMAKVMDSVQSPDALLWRGRVVELSPRSLEDRLALAQTALTFHDYGAAANALNGVAEAGRRTAAFLNLAGALALVENQIDQADACFLEAVRLEPQNPVMQLNLAEVRLQETNASFQAEARAMLGQLVSNSLNCDVRREALSGLTLDAMRHQQPDQALALSRELLNQTNSNFHDRLLRLQVLHDAHPPDFPSFLETVEREAANDPNNTGKIQELVQWQIANRTPAAALAWLGSLSPVVQTNQPVTTLMVECYAAQNDWLGLQNLLERQHWGNQEFLRLAFITRALRGRHLEAAAKAEWEGALNASNQKSAIILLHLATQWHWQKEEQDILWTIVDQHPDEQWAVQSLAQSLIAGGQTHSLLTLFRQQIIREPGDIAAQNNLAMTALLLGAEDLKPVELAREVYQTAPTNASYVSTYAFSLYLQKRNLEALRVMRQLSPEELENPSIAGYYGLILKAAGNEEQAVPYLNRAGRALLLPEEKRLFGLASAGS